jgi:hypothetical protein
MVDSVSVDHLRMFHRGSRLKKAFRQTDAVAKSAIRHQDFSASRCMALFHGALNLHDAVPPRR